MENKESKLVIELKTVATLMSGRQREFYDQMTNDGNDLIIFNDEGKLMKLPYNENATEIYQERVYEGDFLVGDVLICKNSEML